MPQDYFNTPFFDHMKASGLPQNTKHQLPTLTTLHSKTASQIALSVEMLSC